jgi:hypothetical protein
MAVYDLPPGILTECTFTLDDGTVHSASRGGLVTISQIYTPFWRARVQSAPLNQAGMQTWTSWKAKLKGGLNRFRAFDISRRTPLHYLAARAPGDIAPGWNGGATLTGLVNGRVATLSGMPPGYIASAGDRISFERGGSVDLVEITETAVASAQGVMTVEFEPNISPATFPNGTAAKLWQPTALFAIEWQSWQMTVTASASPVSFTAIQVPK